MHWFHLTVYLPSLLTFLSVILSLSMPLWAFTRSPIPCWLRTPAISNFPATRHAAKILTNQNAEVGCKADHRYNFPAKLLVKFWPIKIRKLVANQSHNHMYTKIDNDCTPRIHKHIITKTKKYTKKHSNNSNEQNTHLVSCTTTCHCLCEKWHDT